MVKKSNRAVTFFSAGFDGAATFFSAGFGFSFSSSEDSSDDDDSFFFAAIVSFCNFTKVKR